MATLLHYGGKWGIVNSGSICPNDYKGGKAKKVHYDGDELNFRDVKKELADLMKMTVDIDCGVHGFFIHSIVDGMIFSVVNDKTLMTLWKMIKPDKKGLYHLFASCEKPTYAITTATLRSTNVPYYKTFVAPTIKHTNPSPAIIHVNQIAGVPSSSTHSVSTMYSSSSNTISSICNTPILTADPSVADVVRDWSHALEEVDLDLDIEDLVGVKFPSVEGAKVPLVDDISSGEEDDGDLFDHGKKFGPCVGEVENYFSEPEEEDDDFEYLPEEEEEYLTEIEGSEEGEEDEVDRVWANDELIHDGEETRTFLKMANDVYEDDHVDEVEDVDNLPDTPLYVGMQWPNMKCCRRFFKRYALKKKFMFKQLKNDVRRLRLKCRHPGCEWLVFCSVTKDKFTMELKTLIDNHTCFADPDNKNVHATSLVVSPDMEEFVRTHNDVTPKMIAKELFTKVGVKITYWVAWATRRRLLEKINGNYEEGFKLVPKMCKNILKHNDDSIVRWFVDERTNRFSGLFIAFKASLKGWVEGCRPVIGLDGCFLKGKYQGACLSAMGLDAMDGLFPLAIYITTGEHNESWSMFLSLLHPHVTTRPEPITFISDRQKGLVQSVQDCFPTKFHRYCFRHMYQNFKNAGFRGDYLEQLSWGASKSYKECEFDDYMKVIEGEEKAAHAWLCKVPTCAWARYDFDKVCKCDKVTNNFSESFNSWILHIRDKPLVQFVDKYICALSTLLYERRRISREMEDDTIVPKVMHTIEKYAKKYHKFTVEGISDTKFMALNRHGKKYFVDLEKLTCTCVKWQMSGVPCIHAVAVILPRREPWTRYCSPYYTTEAFRATYAGYIYPLDNIEDWEKVNDIVLPPPVARGPGRPKTVRIRAEDEPAKQSGRHCTACGSNSHNVRTCARRKSGNYSARKAKPVSVGKKTKGKAPEAGDAPIVPTRPRGRPKKSTEPSVVSTSTTPVATARKGKRGLTQESTKDTVPHKRVTRGGVSSQP